MADAYLDVTMNPPPEELARHVCARTLWRELRFLWQDLSNTATIEAHAGLGSPAYFWVESCPPRKINNLGTEFIASLLDG
jgi:hypothetical protein